jgi:hypothetical protein
VLLFPFKEVEINNILSRRPLHPGSQTSGYYFIDKTHREREVDDNLALGTRFKNAV